MTHVTYDLRDRLMWWAATQPEKAAFTFMERGEEITDALTYRALHDRARAIARLLVGAGVSGKPVILLYAPGLAFIEAMFASFLSGAIAVPVPYPVTSRARRRIMGIASACGAEAVLTLESYLANEELRAQIDGATATPAWIATDLIAADENDSRPEAIRRRSPSDIALLQFTSGSTAAPRGVVVSFGNLAANHRMIAASFGDDPASAPAFHDVVTWLPMFHDMGLIGNVLYPLFAGRTAHIMPPFAFLQKPVRWLRAITRLRATTSGGPSFAFDLCARTIPPDEREGLDLRSWTTAFCGAEPVRQASLSRFAEFFGPCGFDPAGFVPCYGLAEATLFVSAVPKGRGMHSSKRRSGVVSCGIAPPPGSIKIVDAQGETLPEGSEGEIWVAGPHVCQGYWREEESTRQTFGAGLRSDPGTPYLRTGDLGFVENGELFVSGRAKDVLIIRGAKHHASDLDRTICGAHPDLLPDAGAVFALEEEGAERIVAIHEVRKSAFLGLDHEAMFRAVARAVSVEHGVRLDRAVFVREGRLPRTTSGKLQRHLCPSLLALSNDESGGRLAS